MSSNAAENRLKMQDIRRRMLRGDITYAEAKAEAEPIIEAIYEQSKIIAKKYKRRAVRLNFASLMRE